MLAHKSQYIGSIILIIISCILYSSFNISMTDSLDNLADFRISSNLEDASFMVQNPIQDLHELENKYDLMLEERKSIDVNYDSSSVLRVLQAAEKIDKYAVVKGKALQHQGDILIDQGFADAHSLSIGDYIKINNVKFKIAGYMTTPDYVYPLKSESDVLKNPKTFGIAVISKEDMGMLGTHLTYYSVKYNKNNAEEFKNALENSNVLIQWINKKDNNRIVFIDSDLRGGVAVGKYLPITILLLTCILISIVLTRLIKGEYFEIGTLYSLGYRKKEILAHYLRYSLIISVTGSITGTVIGSFLVKPLLSMVISYYNLPLLTINFNLKYIIISLLLPLIFLMPVTYIVINRVLKLTPLQLMRGGRNKTKVNFIEKKIKLDRFNFNTKFKIREIIRSLPRTLLLILGVTFASMLLLLGFATKDSMDYVVNKSYKDISSNYAYTFKTFQSGNTYPGEKRSISMFTTNLNNNSKDFAICGVQKDSKLLNMVDEDNNPIDFNQVVMTKSLSDRLHIHPGDEIKVKNKLNSKEFTIKIDKIAQSYIGDTIYMPLQSFNKLNGYPESSYLMIDSKEKLSLPQDMLLSVTTKQDLIDGYDTLLKPFRYMIGGIASVAFIIGLIVIYVVTSLLIEENKGNISMLKILGYKNREISSLILNSSSILVILGFIISVPLLLTSLAGFFSLMTESLDITIPAKLNLINILISFIVIMTAYELSKLLNKRKILSVSMSKSLNEKAE